ncbi:MAG: DUF3795 domain-containing protein [Candidatus Bathyarchaeota archaeon]|nr:DUF3795 domain-containing protein [Candidatus Bathyarchaeota archaeon]
MAQGFDAELFARCGINCRTCVGFFGYTLDGKRQAPCGGCPTRQATCSFFKKYCVNPNREKFDYCYQCLLFPCAELQKIDQYYSGKYGVSLIEAFEHIRSRGMQDYLQSERQKWTCPVCGGVICAQTKRCYSCHP